MLTVPEVAERLGRSPETVRRWIRAGKLASGKVGTQHVVDEAELEKFLSRERPSVAGAVGELVPIYRPGLVERIACDPAIMVGKPCIKGTRIPVYLILEFMANGASVDWLLDSYPHITEDDVAACLAYAAEVIEGSETRDL